MGLTKEMLETEFTCPKCHGRGALVQEVSLGRSVARMIPIASATYVAASCSLCGYTELYHAAAFARCHEEKAATSRRLAAETPE